MQRLVSSSCVILVEHQYPLSSPPLALRQPPQPPFVDIADEICTINLVDLIGLHRVIVLTCTITDYRTLVILS